MIRPLTISTFAVLTLGLTLLLGCAQQTKPTPTLVPEPTDNVVVVVVTATSQPTIATTPTSTVEPTITPLATLTPIGGAPLTPTVKATAAPTKVATKVATKAVAVAAPTVKATEAVTGTTPSAGAPTAGAPIGQPAVTFGAPILIGPEGKTFHDGDSIKFQFQSSGSLQGDQCYKVDVIIDNPGHGQAGDNWVVHCGDQTAPTAPVSFILQNGKFQNAPNYGTILPVASGLGQTDNLILRWFVTVVKNNGQSPDGVHFNTTPLSPPSQTMESNFIP